MPARALHWSRRIRDACIGVALLVFLLACTPASAEQRIALVIGNGSYRDAPLRNPRKDAEAVGALLARAGFAVDGHFDASRYQMRAAMRRFRQALGTDTVRIAVFYYAGHAVQLNWRNYLLPVDAVVRGPADVTRHGLDLGEVMPAGGMLRGRSAVFVLDACRDNPFGGTVAASSGLSQVDAPAGSLLAFATAPGRVALDGDESGGGDHGLYTAHLLRELSRAGVRLEDALKRVRASVRVASRNRQIPWESTSLEEDVYLFPAAPPERVGNASLVEQVAVWDALQSGADVDAISAFIQRHPVGPFSELAQHRLASLLAASAYTPTAQPSGALDAGAPASQSTTSDAATLHVEPTPFSAGLDEHVRRYAVGDRYEFALADAVKRRRTRITMTVTALDGATGRVAFNDGEYVSDAMGNVTRNARGTFDSPRQFYPAEYQVGRRWRTEFRQTRPDGRVYTFRYDLRVAGRERVTVPAGTFDTWRIEARGVNVEAGATLSRTFWVAPGVDADIALETVVRLRNGTVDQDDRQELVAYSRAARDAR